MPTTAWLDWGWLKIGPPYVYLNIDPILYRIGPFQLGNFTIDLPIRWYGLMYVVAIIMGLLAITRYRKQKGIRNEVVDGVLWWCIIAGLIGGRLYFVIQQTDLVQGYLLQPHRIFAFWEGGMAFFGAIFLVIPTLIWRARVAKVNPLVLVDAGVFFGAVGQIFGRIGNIINGDIIGYIDYNLPWAFVYEHPRSWVGAAKFMQPVVPAAVYELLTNVVLVLVIYLLARIVKRPGVLTFVYLFSYCVTQFFIFFVRDNEIFTFFGIGLRQAQWTSIVLFIILIPLSFWVMRGKLAQPIPDGEVAATYGIPQDTETETEAVAEEQSVQDEEDTNVETPSTPAVSEENPEDLASEETPASPSEEETPPEYQTDRIVNLDEIRRLTDQEKVKDL